MHKTQAWLADGRECTFYDRRPMQRDIRADRRSLPARPHAAELRFDVRSGRWVVIAGHRQGRSFRPGAAECPLCPSRGSTATEIPAADYDVVVFDNRFPALTTAGLDPPDLGALADPSGPAASGHAAPAYGRCEIVCFSADHDVSFADLKPDQARLILDVWRDRTEILHATPGIEQVFCFENRGPEIGVTQPHPHGQIYGFPFVTSADSGRRSRRRPIIGVEPAATCTTTRWRRTGRRPTVSSWPTNRGRHSCRTRRSGLTRCIFTRTVGIGI